MSVVELGPEEYILSAEEVICYNETSTALTVEHRQLYDELFEYVQNLLSRQIEWKYIPDQESGTEIDAPEEFYEYLRIYAHKKCVMRHLKGMDYNMDRARASYKQVVEWRITEKIDELDINTYHNELDLALLFTSNERDNAGHAIAYLMFPETAPAEDVWESWIRAVTFACEKGIRMAKEYGLFQITWIVDFKNLGYYTIPPVSKIRELIHMFTSFYPERLHRAFLVNTPWAFRALWTLASPFLTQNTKGKIIMLDSTQSVSASGYEEYISPEALHVNYGGTLNFTYSWQFEYDTCWANQENNQNDQNIQNNDDEIKEDEV